MQRLIRLQTEDSLPLLLTGLEDKTPYIAALAAEGLGAVADISAAAVMVDRFIAVSGDGLKLDPGCHIRANLAYAFGRLEYRHAEAALRLGIRTVQIEHVGGVKYDTGAHLRANCALALAQMRSREALREISLLLFDHGTKTCGSGDARNNFVEPRKAAARALGLLAIAEARVPLTLRLRFPEGESTEVLQECMQALVALEDPDLEDTLMRFINVEPRDFDTDLALFAALMLANAHIPGAEKTLSGLVSILSGNALKAAILALASVRSDEARAELLVLRDHARLAVREAVSTVLDN